MRLGVAAIGIALAIGLLAGCGDDESGGGFLPDPSTVNSPEVKELEGDWTGELHQKGLAPFEVAVRFAPGEPISVAYTGIDCGGTWEWRATASSNPPYYSFEETIDSGAGGECKGSGTVSIHPREPCVNPADNMCAYRTLEYEFHGGGIVSKGVLTATDEARLRKVFDEAGVAPPGD